MRTAALGLPARTRLDRLRALHQRLRFFRQGRRWYVSKYCYVRTDARCLPSVCSAVCCRFAIWSTAEDLADGLDILPGTRSLAKASDGMCYALDPQTRRCRVWARQPIICRVYACKRRLAPERMRTRPFRRREAQAELRQTNRGFLLAAARGAMDGQPLEYLVADESPERGVRGAMSFRRFVISLITLSLMQWLSGTWQGVVRRLGGRS